MEKWKDRLIGASVAAVPLAIYLGWLAVTSLVAGHRADAFLAVMSPEYRVFTGRQAPPPAAAPQAVPKPPPPPPATPAPPPSPSPSS